MNVINKLLSNEQVYPLSDLYQVHLIPKFINSHYKKEQLNNSIQKLQAFEKISAEMYNFTHTLTKGEPPYSCPSKDCLRFWPFLNVAFIHMNSVRVTSGFQPFLTVAFIPMNSPETNWGTGFPSYPISEHEPNPCNKQVTTKYSTYHSHTRHVISIWVVTQTCYPNERSSATP